jgi:hypothetical protein
MPESPIAERRMDARLVGIGLKVPELEGLPARAIRGVEKPPLGGHFGLT